MSDIKNVSTMQACLHGVEANFPHGVSNIIFDYLFDKIIITAEYCQSALEGNVVLMQYIDKKYKSFLTPLQDKRALYDLLIDTLNHKQMTTAVYLRDRIKEEDPTNKYWDIPRDGGSVNEESLAFIMNMVERKQLHEEFLTALHESFNASFVKLFLQRFPDFRFATLKDDVEEDNIRLPCPEDMSLDMAYTIIRYANKENIRNIFLDWSTWCLPQEITPSLSFLMYYFHINYRLCICNKYIIFNNEAMCTDCTTLMRKRMQPPNSGCSYIFVRGERAGERCGGEVVDLRIGRCKTCKRRK